MVVINRTKASLRFFGDDLVPDEVSQLLGGKPTNSAIIGAQVKRSNGKSNSAETGKWLRKAPASQPGDLSAQIRFLVADLTGDLVLWRDLSRRFNGNVFVGFFMNEGNEGCDLSSETLKLLTDRGLALWLDVYGPDGVPG